jgi:hypothetical protein
MSWIWAIVLTLAALLVAPWRLARAVAIPRGWVGLAWLLGRLDARTVWGRDPAAGGLVGAAWALGRRRTPDPAAAARLETRLLRLSPLRGGGLLAAGLLAAARDDLEGARQLIASVEILPAAAVPREAARLARAWRQADAAARGDWAGVVALSRSPRDPLAAVALRLAGGDAPPDDELRLLAVRVPWLRPLVARATAPAAAPAQAAIVIPFRTPAPPDAALRAAVARHATAPTTSDGLRALGAAWDAALAAPDLRRVARERAAAVGAADPERPLALLVAEVEEDLAALALSAGVALPDGPGVLAGAQRRVREQLIADIEGAARSLETRVRAGRTLPPLLEWRELLALRARHVRAGAIGGLALRRLVFEALHDAVCPLACALWNRRGERALADGLFLWLLAEAEAVGHSRLAEHERRNVGATGRTDEVEG